MNKIKISVIALLLFGLSSVQTKAQTASTSDNIVAQKVADRVVLFDVTSTGISKHVEFGADLAWADEKNFRRNILFMGLDQIDIVRASFQPTYALVNGTDLTTNQINDLNYRLWLINTYVGSNVDLAINCDHAYNDVTDKFVDPWYVGQPSRWHQLIKESVKMYKNAGHNIITIGAFNEPDYGWDQYTGGWPQGKLDMYNITSLLKNDSFFNNIRLSGGNTLNCDAAQEWYDYLRPAGVNEGNTHQLAGSFDGYASFIQHVRNKGDYAMLDELHNIGEALVGYEYGMQGGIWWADIDFASGEMVKAFDGQRLGYAEHRPNWTAAAVYRSPEGKIQAFGGTSERQAVKTTFGFVSKDKVVYYDGQGPQRVYALEMPGGTGYSTGQTNAERVVNITYGEDVQPAVNGRYKLVNRQTGQVMIVAGNFNGANVSVGNYTGSSMQQWDVAPVNSRVGGDFSYSYIKPASSTSRRLDLDNFSLEPGANIHLWSDGNGGNQQWYLDYNEEGWFYIRSRESSHCLDLNGTNVEQMEKNGSESQQWRFIATTAQIDSNAPSAPSNLVATAQAASVKLNWTASPEGDVAGYTIFRAESSGGEYNTIARNVTVTSFVDNTTVAGKQYFYKVKAVDGSLNRSAYSNEVSATITAVDNLIAQLEFNDNTSDSSVNLNHGASNETVTYVKDIFGGKAIALNGTSNFVQLPADIANSQEITIAAWVYWDGTSAGNQQRIFDFGNGEQEYMFLSPSSNGKMRFAITNTGYMSEQFLEIDQLDSKLWRHVAITLGASGVRIYVNGVQVGENTGITLSPKDFMPVKNYIGQSQWVNDAKFDGNIDDFRIYNYELTAGEIAAISGFPANDAPVAVTDKITVSQGATATVLVGGATSVLTNDTDAQDNFLTSILVNSPVNGTLALNSDGTFKYIHNGLNIDSDSFTYKANDGIVDSNIVTVDIIITPFELPNNNFTVEAVSEKCEGKNNGEIIINAVRSLTYTATINGTNYDFVNRNLTVSDLAPGSYEVCIGVTGKVFEQCYNLTIDPATNITGKTIASSDKLQVEIESGTAPYKVAVNGVVQFETNNADFDVAVNPGDLLEVSTAKICEGVLSKKITVYDVVTASPNPTSGQFDIYLPTNDTSVAIGIYNIEGKLISMKQYLIEDGKVHLNIENEAVGIYLVRVQSNPVETIKIIKK